MGILTILDTGLVVARWFKLEQGGPRPLSGRKSGVTEEYGVLASCDEKGNGFVITGVGVHWSHAIHWLCGLIWNLLQKVNCVCGGEGSMVV